jgi:hypothetical protein
VKSEVTWSSGTPGSEWSPGGIKSGDRHLGTRSLESQVFDISSGDSPIGKSPIYGAVDC